MPAMNPAQPLTVAVVGATGVVGRTMIQILNEREFPVGDLRLLASGRSAGRTVSIEGRTLEIGSLYLGKVTRIMGFGAFVEILPGKEGLVRIGELADYHVPSVEDVVSVGDEVMVVVTEVDRQGRINLSRKAAMQRHLAKDPV